MSLDPPVPAGGLVELAASATISQSLLVLGETRSGVLTGNSSGRIFLVLPSSSLVR